MAKEPCKEETTDYSKFTLVDTTSEIFTDILKRQETILDPLWEKAIKRKASHGIFSTKTNFRTVITIQDKNGNPLTLKYRVGHGDELASVKIDEHHTFVTMDDPSEIFHQIKETKYGKLEERVQNELDEYEMGIYKILNGEQNARFIIFVPGHGKPFKYKIGDGTNRELVLKLGIKTTAEYLREFKETVQGHWMKHYMLYFGVVSALVLFLAGYNTNDVIKVIHVFDPHVTAKMYEVLSILLNRTDTAPKTNI